MCIKMSYPQVINKLSTKMMRVLHIKTSEKKMWITFAQKVSMSK